MAVQMNLPQMRSIWIDEDQEAEKLYGLQVQHLMDSDGEDQVDMMLINSDRPVLNNKERIALPPLMPAAYKPSRAKKPLQKLSESTNSSSQTKTKTKKSGGKFLKFFRSKETRSGIPSAKISVPFNFQHISHADLKNVFEGEEETFEEPVSPIALNKAFVTKSPEPMHSALDRKKSYGSKSPSLRRASSLASSQYSAATARIVSTSTMATSVNDYSSSLKKLDQLEKIHLKHKYNKSDASSVSVEFLKNYSFPTVLEDVSLTEVKTPEMSKDQCDRFTWESPENSEALLETMLQTKSPMLGNVSSQPRRKSDSQLLVSPMCEQRSSYLDTPKTRKSVDDVLLCYHQPSETSSEACCSTEFSFSPGSGKGNARTSWGR
ncbi:LAFA_0G06788g1_1 [Lachancea sp. 'fantastica']|nr:LAFA_0G06788g1_1 [Lachancea sp. 'fantastica']